MTIPKPDVTEIVEKVNNHRTETTPLRTRMDRHFDLVTLTDYEVPKEEGNFESMTTNDPFVQQTKITDMLADAYPQFSISMIKARPGKQERERIATTERLVYGFLQMANKRQGDFMQPPVQQQLAWHSPVRGWVGQRLLLWQDEDKNVVPDYVVWDVRNTYWGVGAKGLLWACLVYDKSVEAAEDEYNLSNVAHDRTGFITCYDYLDAEREITIIGDTIVNSYDHKLGRVPVYIRPTGSMPKTQIAETLANNTAVLHTGKRTATTNSSIEHQGISILAGTADLFDIRSKILSYILTIVGQGAHTPLIVEYGGGAQPSLAADPYIKGQTVFLDSSQGQKITPLFKPVTPAEAFTLLADIDRQISTAGAPPILFGGGKGSSETASGLNLLSYYAKTVLMPHQRAIEGALEWMAMELIRQFKDNGYSIDNLEGMDKLKKDFCINIKPDDVVDDRHVKCTLIPDLIQDVVSKAGVATQLVREGIWSKQYARDWLGVQDTDAMQKEVFTEQAMADPMVKADIMADALREENPELAKRVLANAEREAQKQQPAEKGIDIEKTVSMPTPPTLQTGNMQKPLNIPPEVAQELQGAI
jgi:hypothetical protein